MLQQEAMLAVAALALAVVAAAVIWYLVALVAGATGFSLFRFAGTLGFSRCAAQAQRADRLIERGDVEGALAAIRSAFYLRSVHDPKLASTIADHHTGLLSRMLALTAEQRSEGVRLIALAKVDRLLAERAALQRRLISVRRGAPRSHVDEVGSRLVDNAAQLGEALDQLATEIRGSQQRPTLH